MAEVQMKDVVVGVGGLYEVSQEGAQEGPPVTVVSLDREQGVCAVRIGLTDRVHDDLPVERLRCRKVAQDATAMPSDSDSAEEGQLVNSGTVAMPMSPLEKGGALGSPTQVHRVETGKAPQRSAKRTDRSNSHRDPKGGTKGKRRSAFSTRTLTPPEQSLSSTRGEEWTAEEIISRWRRLPHKQKCKVGEVISKEHQDELSCVLRVEKAPDERLGVTCQLNNMQLLRVKEGSPADRAGAADFIGRILTHANNTPCSTLERLVSIAQGKSLVKLRFTPPPSGFDAPCTPLVHRVDSTISRNHLPGVGKHILRHYAIPTRDITVSGTLLGKGSFGEVYKGSYQELPVAVKVQRVDSRDTDITEWKREVKVMTRLRHPNILMLIGACFDRRELMIVTELCDRGTLRDVFWSKSAVPRQWSEKLDWCMQIALGMAFLHHKGIFHRDLKPSNVFVNGATLKVADFGLSKLRAAMARMTPHSRPVDAGKGSGDWMDSFAINAVDLTVRGEPVRDPASGARTGLVDDRFVEIPGTFAFIAPEVWAEQPFTHAADVYSFGITIVEIVTRSVPAGSSRTTHGGRSGADWKIMTGRIRPTLPSQVGGVEVPPELLRITAEAIAFVPEERPTCVLLARRLRKLLGECVDATGRDLFGDAPWPDRHEDLQLTVECPPHPTRAGDFW
eukprot:Hpha_TRINITY_DN3606_c1_g1::TRINITY_DN3606_c1_g1_i1::g.1076::m.1076